MEENNEKNTESWDTYTCALAASEGRFDILKYLLEEKNYECSEWVMAIAAGRGDYRMVKYLHEKGIPWGEWTCTTTAKEGHLEVLKYVIEGGCPMDKRAVKNAAARSGMFEILEYLNRIGICWDEETCYITASKGQLETLKLLRQNGCPWDGWTCFFARRNGHYDVLQWARENGCPSG